MSALAQNTAYEVFESVPLLMRVIRAKFHEQRATEISVPQFRALAYINRNAGASLSELAGHIGLTLPSMSKLIDGLVNRNLVQRNSHSEDRRKICLRLTAEGQDELRLAHDHTQAFLAEKLSDLSEDDLKAIFHAMQVLRGLFITNPEKEIIQNTE